MDRFKPIFSVKNDSSTLKRPQKQFLKRSLHTNMHHTVGVLTEIQLYVVWKCSQNLKMGSFGKFSCFVFVCVCFQSFSGHSISGWAQNCFLTDTSYRTCIMYFRKTTLQFLIISEKSFFLACILTSPVLSRHASEHKHTHLWDLGTRHFDEENPILLWLILFRTFLESCFNSLVVNCSGGGGGVK